jgi:hypothetical protein
VKRTLQAGLADDERRVADAQRVRERVFVEEKGLLGHGAAPSGREVDAWDDLGSTLHFIVYVDGAPAATARLLRPDPAVARAIGQPMGIDLASRYDLGALDVPSLSLAEVSRMCVVPELRGSEVLLALYGVMVDESARAGVTHWVAAANTETDVLEDAAIAYRIAGREGLLSRTFQVSPRPGVSGSGPSTRPLYTPEQRVRARAGDLDGLPLPRTLQTFARLGARYLGPPLRERGYTVCSLPLVVDLAEVRRARIPLAA